MTTPSGDSPDDGFWRRPAGVPADTPMPTTGTPAAATPPDLPAPATYAGPPPTAPPPPGWRPPVHLQPPPPRQLPTQDLLALEEEERGARTVTYGVGLIAGAVLIVVICLLCSRVVF